MIDIVETKQVKAARVMGQSVLDAQNKIGRITGAPGTGKTIIGHDLINHYDGVRLCAYAGINDKGLIGGLAAAFGLSDQGTAGTLLMRLMRHVENRLIIIDEANHLTWRHIERLRYLPDEAGAGLILLGTDLLERTFKDGRSAIYLRQMAGRIGAKQLHLAPMKNEGELALHILEPQFGKVTKPTAKIFMNGCGGYWRLAHELAEACQRIMAQSEISLLNEDIIKSAMQYLAIQKVA